MTHLTQAAAQRCADLANAETTPSGGAYVADVFLTGCFRSDTAFRRYVERIDAEAREVLALLDDGTNCSFEAAKAILRDNLLPDPQPTLLEEYVAGHPNHTCSNSAYQLGVEHALDWIAKREVKS